MTEPMKQSEKSELYKRAVEAWGEDTQVGMVIEEMAELTVALRHYSRNRATVDEIIEEIADVENAIAQLKHIFGIDNLHLSFVKDSKLLRLKGLLDASPQA